MDTMTNKQLIRLQRIKLTETKFPSLSQSLRDNGTNKWERIVLKAKRKVVKKKKNG